MLSFSQASNPRFQYHHRLRLFRWPRRFALAASANDFTDPSIQRFYANSYYGVELKVSKVHTTGFCQSRSLNQVRAFDQDSFDFDIPSLENFGDNEGTTGYVLPSSDGEDSDTEIILSPHSDVDFPTVSVHNSDALTVTAHRLGMVGRGHKRHRVKHGVFTNMGLIIFLMVVLLYVDCCAWRIVRLPLGPFHFTGPFLTSAFLASCAGYICVPLLYQLKVHQIIKQKRPIRHALKRKTPTMGGLFFVPIGIAVAKLFAGISPEVTGASVATIAFSAIGLVAVGTWFSFWMEATSISSPYSMKMLIPLPAPLGLLCLGKCYMLLTSFCFVAMGNGINLTDGLDGLAGGTAALAFIGMAIAVLPISSDLSIFGASMSGACVGFLLHNRYKASVFMGDTGSFALGGALAAMAACTGMFFPLFISSLIFMIEMSSVIMQVLYFKVTKQLTGAGCRIFRMVPFHRHLELCGIKEPFIVAGAYSITSMLALLAGYVGLISA